VQAAGRPLAAAEMVLVRLAYVADLPTPDEVIRALRDGGAPSQGNGAAAESSNARPGVASGAAQTSAPRFDAPRGAPRAAAAPVARALGDALAQPQEAPQSAPVLAVSTFEELVALAAQKRDLQIKAALERDVRPVCCEDGRLEIALESGAGRTLVNDLSRKLQQWTGRRWMVIVSAEPGAATLKAQADARRAELETGVRADPLVKAVLERFPGAEIVDVRSPANKASDEPPEPPPDQDLPPADGDGFGDNWVRDDDSEQD
jgi:DNA polymerase-3 subunit gamma/tau